jgi:hypothetical protein
VFGDLASEVIHCPNCKEDVPRTLYCLNCGYPLYKIEKSSEVSEPEPETLEVLAKEEAVVEPEIEEPVAIEEAAEPLEIEEPAPEPEEAEEEVIIEVDEAEPEVTEPEEVPAEETPEIQVEPEPTPEPKYTIDEETRAEVAKELQEEAHEAPARRMPEPEPPVYEEPSPKPEVKYVPLKMEPIEVEEMRGEFAPDPLTKEVMDSLAKNITLKIRLVKLLKDGQVKEETFKKLFDSYVEQGKLWVSRRDEIIKRFNADIDRMENALVTARKDHELLEIRKSIGDADEEEYRVKAPAYKWDIEHLDREIKNRKGGIVYVSELKSMVPEDEISELERMADTDYGELDGVEAVSPDTLESMKDALREARSSLMS